MDEFIGLITHLCLPEADSYVSLTYSTSVLSALTIVSSLFEKRRSCVNWLWRMMCLDSQVFWNASISIIWCCTVSQPVNILSSWLARYNYLLPPVSTVLDAYPRIWNLNDAMHTIWQSSVTNSALGFYRMYGPKNTDIRAHLIACSSTRLSPPCPTYTRSSMGKLISLPVH